MAEHRSEEGWPDSLLAVDTMKGINKNYLFLVLVLATCCVLMFFLSGRRPKGSAVLVDDAFHLGQQREEVMTKLKVLRYQPAAVSKGLQETYELDHGERYLAFSYEAGLVVAIGGDFSKMRIGEQVILNGTEGTQIKQVLGPAQDEKRLSHERVIVSYERWGLALLFDRGRVKSFTLRVD